MNILGCTFSINRIFHTIFYGIMTYEHTNTNNIQEAQMQIIFMHRLGAEF